MNELALFAGAGGGILGGKLLGWRTVCAVEWGEYPASVLVQRQNDGLLEAFPVWDDVCTFDGRPWAGRVDVVSGGFPCQDISVAGKGAGITGARSGMWTQMARIISEVRPRFVFVENSPALLTRGLGVVLGDLAALGYDCRWGVLGAADVGANHQRDRFWLVANANMSKRREVGGSCDRLAQRQDGLLSFREEGSDRPCSGSKEMVNTSSRRHGAQNSKIHAGRNGIEHADWWRTEPDVGRMANGVAARVDRLRAIGNGQVPLCAASAWRMLTATING